MSEKTLGTVERLRTNASVGSIHAGKNLRISVTVRRRCILFGASN